MESQTKDEQKVEYAKQWPDDKSGQRTCQENTKVACQAYLDGNTIKKYAPEAKQKITAIKKRETEEKLRLSVWKPLDYLRLLWWILVMPQQLQAHREFCGEEEQERVGKWLVSTLIWLPFLIPLLGLGLELLPHSSKAWSADTYLIWSAVVFVCWLLTGWLGDVEDEDADKVAIGVALVVAVVVAFVVEESSKTGTPSWIARFIFLVLVADYIFLIVSSFGGWRLFV